MTFWEKKSKRLSTKPRMPGFEQLPSMLKTFPAAFTFISFVRLRCN